MSKLIDKVSIIQDVRMPDNKMSGAWMNPVMRLLCLMTSSIDGALIFAGAHLCNGILVVDNDQYMC